MKPVSITIGFQDMLSLRYCHHVNTFLIACLLVKLLALSVFGFTERKLYWYLVMQQQVDQFTFQSYFPKLTFMDTLLYSFGFVLLSFPCFFTLYNSVLQLLCLKVALTSTVTSNLDPNIQNYSI